MALPSYSSPYQLGHRAVAFILDGTVLVQEKVDGSQISFGVLTNADGECTLFARSKGAQLNLVAPDKMFAKGIQTILELEPLLTPGYVYRGEYLNKPKHNVLAYDRVPNKHIILFDVQDLKQGAEYYLDEEALKAEATRLGLETVPTLFQGDIRSMDQVRDFLERTSVLGGAKIEGVVIKNYAKYTPDHKVAMAKFVSEAFKEVHAGEWRKENPTAGDIQDRLIAGLKTPARYQKAIQHLRERGMLTDSPKDIGHLIKEVQEDIKKECEEEIKDALYAHFLPHILRGVVGGFPEWYKNYLMENVIRDAAE